jgi:uncharacterized protein (TIGR03545 family)
MGKNIPPMFRKPIKEKRFQKRILKFLEQPDDKTFLTSCFDLADGVYTIKAELGPEVPKRLKTLAKAIGINRKGTVKILPLTALAVLIAGGIFFFTVMMDPLLEGLLEKGLQEVFEAKCDVNNFHLGLYRFRISIGSMIVANRDEPMRNLFETARLEIRLRPQAVLRGKIYIEEIRADGLQFGTPRTVSGAMPQYAARIAERKNKPPAPPLIDLAKFDAMGLLNQEYDKLASPKAYAQTIAAYDEAQKRWEAQYKEANSKAAELQTASEPVMKININDLKTPEEITKAIADINTLLGSIDNARTEVGNIVNGVGNDINTAAALERSAREAIEGDLNHLKSYLDLGSGEAFKALEPTIMAMLSDQAQGYIAYGQRAMEALEKIKALQARFPKSEPKPEKQTYKGRNVAFPTQAYPVFFLGVMASDFTLSGWNWGFDLRNISSDPDLSNSATELYLALSEMGSYGRTGRFAGMADFRSNAQRYFSVDLSGGNFPVDIRQNLSAVGIGGFTGKTGFALNFAGGRGGAISGGGGIDVSQPQLVNPEGTIAESIQEALIEVSALNLGIQYEHPASGDDSFSLTTNINDFILAALKKAVEKYLRQAEEAIEKALRERIASYLDGKWVSKEELDTIFSAVKGDQAAVNKLKAALEEKKSEAERKIRGAADEAVEKAEAEAKAQAEEALKKASENLPALPGGIKLPF